MTIKNDVTVGVIEKVREYYESKPYLAGLIKVDRLSNTDRYGDEIHIYYEKIYKYDKVFVNGVEMTVKQGDTE